MYVPKCVGDLRQESDKLARSLSNGEANLYSSATGLRMKSKRLKRRSGRHYEIHNQILIALRSQNG